MQIRLIIFCLLFPFLLVGCASEKEDLSKYLAVLQRSNQAMTEQFEVMSEQLKLIPSQKASGEFNADETKQVVDQTRKLLESEIQRISILKEPPAASALKFTTIKSYDCNLDQLAQLQEYCRLLGEREDINFQLNQESTPELFSQMNELQKKTDSVQARLREIYEQSLKLQKDVVNERNRLQDKYGIAIQSEQ